MSEENNAFESREEEKRGKHYSHKSTTSAESFLFYLDEASLLKDLLAWWEEIAAKEESACLHAIAITWDEGGCNAEVYYDYLTAEQSEAVKRSVSTPQPLKLNRKDINTN